MSLSAKSAVIAAVLSAGLVFATSVGAKTEIRVGTLLAPDDPMGQGLEKFSREVAEATGGEVKVEVKVEVFHNSQLGDTTEMLDQGRSSSSPAT